MMGKRKRILYVFVAASVACGTSACQTMDQNRRATGAVIGGAAGTAAGALIDRDNPWRGALIGAVAGAALGTGVGHVLQRQKEAFDRIEGLETQQQTVILQQPPVSYGTGEPAPPQSTRAAALNVRMSSDVLFDRGSSALSPRGTSKVAEVAQVLRQYPGSDVYIRGYTSSEGIDRSNFELSQRRAEVVRNELIAQGIGPAGVFAQGMGSSNPVASNDTEAGRVQNRRVELIIVPRSTG